MGKNLKNVLFKYSIEKHLAVKLYFLRLYFAKLVSYKEPQLKKTHNNLFFSQEFTVVLFLSLWGVILSASVNLLINGKTTPFSFCL